MQMLSYDQTDYLYRKYENDLIQFRWLAEDGTFWEMADPDWVWENTEPANDIEFVKKD